MTVIAIVVAIVIAIVIAIVVAIVIVHNPPILMDAYFVERQQLPRKRPDYRESRPHHSFLAEVATIFPHLTIDDFFQHTCEQYGKLFNTTRLNGYGQVIEGLEFQSLDNDYRRMYPSFVPRTAYLTDDEMIFIT